MSLNFYFSSKDPKFISKNVVVEAASPNYISHAFVRCPIYNLKGEKIGYKVSDDYVQQVSHNKYVVRLNNTYTFKDGTISWQYVFENDKPEIFYPVGIPAISNIISTTGSYYGKTGTVTLIPLADGKRNVNISFNTN
jgi:hypothetical protein